MKHLLLKSTGKKFRERVCDKCENEIDSGSHPAIESYEEHDHFKSGLGHEMDQENDASGVNSASKLIPYDGMKKINLMSPKPINKSSNSFTFTNYLLSPTPGKKGMKVKSGNDVSTDAAASSDGSTMLESTATTITANASICSAQSSVHFNESDEAKVPEPNKEEQAQPSAASSHEFTASGYSADGSVNFLDNSATPAYDSGIADYEASLTAPSVASTASTVFTNASISSDSTKQSDLSAAKAQSYDLFISGMEGGGTEARTVKLPPTSDDAEYSTAAETETEGVLEGSVISEDSNKSFSQKLLEVSTCHNSDEEHQPVIQEHDEGLIYERTESSESMNTTEDFTAGAAAATAAAVAGAKRSQVLARTGAMSVSASDGSAIDFEGGDASMSTMVLTADDASLLKGVKGCGGIFESTSEAVLAVEETITNTEADTSVEFNSTSATQEEADTDIDIATVDEFASKLGSKQASALRKVAAVLVAFIVALLAICDKMPGISPRQASLRTASLVSLTNTFDVRPVKGKSKGKEGQLVSVLPQKRLGPNVRTYPATRSVSIFSNQRPLRQKVASRNQELSAHLVSDTKAASIHGAKAVDPIVYMAQQLLKAPFKLVSAIIGEIRLLGSEISSPGFAESIM